MRKPIFSNLHVVKLRVSSNIDNLPRIYRNVNVKYPMYIKTFYLLLVSLLCTNTKQLNNPFRHILYRVMNSTIELCVPLRDSFPKINRQLFHEVAQ
jgi:hypothetical protein